MDSSLKHRLSQVGRRIKSIRLGWSLSALWLGFALIGLVFVIVRQTGGLPSPDLPWLWLITLSCCAVGVVLFHVLRPTNLGAVARRIESHFPNLNEELITATDIRRDGDGSLGYLERSVIASAIRHDILYRWKRVISGIGIALSWLSNIPAVVCVLLVGFALWKPAPEVQNNTVAKLPEVARLTEVEIKPGSTEIERNTSLIVTARFNPDEVPDRVWLEYELDSKTETEFPLVRVPMRQSLQDPIFAAYLNSVDQDLRYRVLYDEEKSGEYRVRVFDYPALVRADAVLIYPAYTGLPEKTVVDTRRVVAAKGTQLTWQVELNKPVASAELVSPQDGSLKLEPINVEGTRVAAAIELSDSRQWTLKLIDAEGRSNKAETQLSAKVLPNKATTIRLTASGDTVASPLEELQVKAKIKDDFSIQAAGIGFQIGGEEPIERAAFRAGADQTKMHEIEEMIDLEGLQAKPRDLLSYYVWAEDVDETGEPRRVVSDMFFAEVRPFDEVFREGDQSGSQQQQQQQQQQGGNQQTEELLEVQKQIIVSTWNTLKLARRDSLIGRARPDIVTIGESQSQAIQLLEEKAQESNVEGAEQIIAAINGHMESAVKKLELAADSLVKADLQQALFSEQAAYQELLRLQNAEFEVSQQQQQSQSRSSARSQRRQQQIDQLRLENDMNRYEQERQAQEEQNPEQAELRQIISRLRELAARQEDINEQLRELEAALQAAENEEEKAELEKQLERLREQQQEMLQDSDEVQERIESSESEAVQDLQEKMEQARENLQQSSEALRQQNPSQALASGTRAEQELSELREEARQQAANQFSESMQNMRQRAQELEKRQEEIVDQLEGSREQEAKPGLRADEPDANTAEALQQQVEGLESLLEQMQQTVLESEEAEPLLAEKLYESYRETQQQQATERLDVTRQLVERNLMPQARGLAEESVEDLQQLREQIEDAAEAVLGSEVQSLKRALNQIDALSEELDTEIAEATGQPRPGQSRQENEAGDATEREQNQSGSGSRQENASDNGSAEEDGQSSQPSQEEQDEREGQRQDGQPQDGQPQDGQPQDGQPQDGQPQDGQPQDGQPQNGQPQNGQPQNGQPQNGQPQNGQPQNGQPQNGASNSEEQSDEPREGQGQNGGGGRSENANEERPRGQRSPQGEPGLRTQSSQTGGSASSSTAETWGAGNPRPLTGDEYREWSDRLRDVEELVVDPELRWQATQIRQAAREIRGEMKKHGKDPQWAEVEDLVAEPLRDLKMKVSEELIRRAAEKTEIVPIDRDPVPSQFTRSVREYYEKLGIGE